MHYNVNGLEYKLMAKPLLPFQPKTTEKKLQININSEDDAKAVIQHLGLIKKTFGTLQDTAGVESIEFCIAQSMRKKVETTLTGAINWCRTWVKEVMPFEGNFHFALPHYQEPVKCKTITTVATPQDVQHEMRQDIAPVPVAPEPEVKPAKPNRYLRNLESSGKSASPVQTLLTEGT